MEMCNKWILFILIDPSHQHQHKKTKKRQGPQHSIIKELYCIMTAWKIQIPATVKPVENGHLKIDKL